MKFEYLTIDWTPEGKYPFFNAFLSVRLNNEKNIALGGRCS